MNKLTFFGAARRVTGQCFLAAVPAASFLVDCGMFQGGREAGERNRMPFPFDPRSLRFVILTHAHIDHSGLLPRLWRDGFRNPIYATQATIDLLGVMLPDSAFLQEAEARRSSKQLRREPIEPLYSADDVREVLRLFRAVRYDEDFAPARGVRARLRDAGHILGSAIAEITLGQGPAAKRLVVSGDLGQPGRPILRDPTSIHEADLLVVESTYGDRNHRSLSATLDELVEAVDRTLHVKRGIVVIPAFAVGRTQEVLYFLDQLCRENRLRNLDVFVDSPMATAVTRLTARHFELFDEEAHRLATSRDTGRVAMQLQFTESVQESMALNQIQSSAIIVAGSGMCDGGRVRHHLRRLLPDERNTVLITGFQAAGTLGRRLVDRATSVRIFGEEIPVRAEVVTLGGFSAHADQAALIQWLREFHAPPARVCLVHGEDRVLEAFAERIATDLRWDTLIPQQGESIDF
jgi:metallo-beta-lactamase family protein